MASRDALTARDESVPRRDPNVLTLADCRRVFVRQRTPPLLAAAIVAALGLRGALGSYDWRDVVVAAGVLGRTPLAEWLIHVYLLHAKPFTIRGLRFDLLAAREHRAHHQSPAELDGVLIPSYAIVIFVPLLALIVWAASFPVHLVLGGNRLAHAATGCSSATRSSACTSGATSSSTRHTRPRSCYYRAIWRGHRLHHYKNEHYWFGVTSTVGDQILRTAPDQSTVPKSRTARTLGVDAPS